MTIKEFVEKYNLHDSLLESINYDKNNRKATLSIDFCYWQQEDYEETLSETGMVLIEFDDVISLNYKHFPINSDEIVECVLEMRKNFSLCRIDEDKSKHKEPSIICSMGLKYQS